MKLFNGLAHALIEDLLPARSVVPARSADRRSEPIMYIRLVPMMPFELDNAALKNRRCIYRRVSSFQADIYLMRQGRR